MKGPIKDIVDEVYSVYLWIVREPTSAPRECSVLREPWRGDGAAAAAADDDDLDLPRASVELARRVQTMSGGRWAGAKGFGFGPRGTLRTPWGSGVWGVLPDKPGLLFADFGGSRHELSFDAWPAFTSARCADGDVVRGELFA